MPRRLSIIAVSAALALGGCGGNPHHTARGLLASVQPGMSRLKVISALGEPDQLYPVGSEEEVDVYKGSDGYAVVHYVQGSVADFHPTDQVVVSPQP